MNYDLFKILVNIVKFFSLVTEFNIKLSSKKCNFNLGHFNCLKENTWD